MAVPPQAFCPFDRETLFANTRSADLLVNALLDKKGYWRPIALPIQGRHTDRNFLSLR